MADEGKKIRTVRRSSVLNSLYEDLAARERRRGKSEAVTAIVKPKSCRASGCGKRMIKGRALSQFWHSSESRQSKSNRRLTGGQKKAKGK